MQRYQEVSNLVKMVNIYHVVVLLINITESDYTGVFMFYAVTSRTYYCTELEMQVLVWRGILKQTL